MIRYLTGVQPSGKLHLGNYFGVIKKLVEKQKSTDLFCFLANYHALTTFTSKEELEENTFKAACDFMALGIDPENCTFWLQSDYPEVHELAWYLSTCITVSKLELAHSFKDKVAKGFTPHAALFNYPVLMAADILAFDSDVVPVGKDQKQHLEFARDIAIKFNQTYGETLKVPEPEIEEATAIVPGTDGQKMSKSYGNTINFFDDEKSLKKSVMSIVSDSADIDEPKDPDKSVIYSIYSLFLEEGEKQELRNRFLTPGLRYGDVKKELLERILEHFRPFRKRREELEKDPGYVKEILQKGSVKARLVAEPLMEKIRSQIGIYR